MMLFVCVYYVAVRVPFPLTMRFKDMLQQEYTLRRKMGYAYSELAYA